MAIAGQGRCSACSVGRGEAQTFHALSESCRAALSETRNPVCFAKLTASAHFTLGYRTALSALAWPESSRAALNFTVLRWVFRALVRRRGWVPFPLDADPTITPQSRTRQPAGQAKPKESRGNGPGPCRGRQNRVFRVFKRIRRLASLGITHPRFRTRSSLDKPDIKYRAHRTASGPRSP